METFVSVTTIEVNEGAYEPQPVMIGGEEFPGNFFIEVPCGKIDKIIESYHQRGACIIYSHFHTDHSRVEKLVHGVTRMAYNMFQARDLRVVDSLMSVQEVAKILARRNVTHVILTDHDTMAGVLELEQFARGRFTVIPGIEFTTGYGHLLVIGAMLSKREIDEISEILYGLDPSNEADKKKFMNVYHSLIARGLIVQAAHPHDFRDPWLGPAIGGEIHNCASNSQLLGMKRTKFPPSKTGQMVSIVGNDAHDYAQLSKGGNFTVVMGVPPDANPLDVMINGDAVSIHVVEKAPRLQIVPPVVWRIPRMLNEQARANDMPFIAILGKVLIHGNVPAIEPPRINSSHAMKTIAFAGALLLARFLTKKPLWRNI